MRDSVKYCCFLLDAEVTDSALLALSKEILSDKVRRDTDRKAGRQRQADRQGGRDKQAETDRDRFRQRLLAFGTGDR